jgi:class 3 adenylate cyclase
MAALDGAFQSDPVGPLTLKGFSNPVPAFALKNRGQSPVS